MTRDAVGTTLSVMGSRLGWRWRIGLLGAWSVTMTLLVLLASRSIQLAGTPQVAPAGQAFVLGSLHAATIGLAAMLALVWIGTPVLVLFLYQQLEAGRAREERLREGRGNVVLLSAWRDRPTPRQAWSIGS